MSFLSRFSAKRHSIIKNRTSINFDVPKQDYHIIETKDLKYKEDGLYHSLSSFENTPKKPRYDIKT
jgi:hypothetical protein